MKFKVGDRVVVDNIAGNPDVGSWSGEYTIKKVNPTSRWPYTVEHPKLSVGAFAESELRLIDKHYTYADAYAIGVEHGKNALRAELKRLLDL